jgi:succinate dehydrogenase / fumarate reductase flavoprotein subunit
MGISVPDEVFEKDILVIGSGIAGLSAAYFASKQGADVILLTKGFAGKSGCSVQAAQFGGGIVFLPEKDQYAYFRSRLFNFIGDQELAWQIVKGINEVNPAKVLEEIGVLWRRKDDGSILVTAMRLNKEGQPALPFYLWSEKMGDTAKTVSSSLRQEILRRGVEILDNTTCTKLLTKEGEVVGATAYNYEQGLFILVKAKSVILATGSAKLWKYHTEAREAVGEGYILALEAGAQLVNMEFNTYHEAEMVWPWSLHLGNLYLYTHGGFGVAKDPKTGKYKTFAPSKFYNMKGEEFSITHKLGERMAVELQIQKGFARKDGGYYVSFEGRDPEFMEAFYYQFNALKHLGIDIIKDKIEVRTSCHNMIGGIKIKPGTAETNVPGLFACGAVASECLGLHNCMVSASWAANSAVKRAKEIKVPIIDFDQVKEEENRVLNWLRRTRDMIGDGIPPIKIKREIMDIMWEKCNYMKCEEDLVEALRQLRMIREKMMPRMFLRTNTQKWNYDLVEALEVPRMLLCAEIIVTASLMRKESRGDFQRKDYPETDNKNWLKNIVIKFENGKLKFDLVPVKLTYVRPEE